MKVGNDVLFQEPTVNIRRLRRSVVIAADDGSISVRFVGDPFDFTVDQEILMFFNGKREFMQQVGRIIEIQQPEPIVDPAASPEAAEAAAPPPEKSIAKPAPAVTVSKALGKSAIASKGKVAVAGAKSAAAATAAAVPEKKKEGPVFVIEPVGDPISAENRQSYRVSTISAGIQARMGGESGLQVQDLSATGFALLADKKYKIGQTVEVAIRYGDEACHGKASIQSFRELESGRLRYGVRAIEEDPHAQTFLRTLQRISLAVQREQLARSGGVR
ncbi:MAG: hypothetical protein U0900_19380 [Myxococcota bacterium]